MTVGKFMADNFKGTERTIVNTIATSEKCSISIHAHCLELLYYSKEIASLHMQAYGYSYHHSFAFRVYLNNSRMFSHCPMNIYTGFIRLI